jgi:hypothetical protein
MSTCDIRTHEQQDTAPYRRFKAKGRITVGCVHTCPAPRAAIPASAIQSSSELVFIATHKSKENGQNKDDRRDDDHLCGPKVDCGRCGRSFKGIAARHSSLGLVSSSILVSLCAVASRRQRGVDKLHILQWCIAHRGVCCALGLGEGEGVCSAGCRGKHIAWLQCTVCRHAGLRHDQCLRVVRVVCALDLQRYLTNIRVSSSTTSLTALGLNIPMNASAIFDSRERSLPRTCVSVRLVEASTAMILQIQSDKSKYLNLAMRGFFNSVYASAHRLRTSLCRDMGDGVASCLHPHVTTHASAHIQTQPYSTSVSLISVSPSVDPPGQQHVPAHVGSTGRTFLCLCDRMALE